MTKQPDLFDKLTAKADELRAHAKKMERQAARLAKAQAEEREARIQELSLVLASVLAVMREAPSKNESHAIRKMAASKMVRDVLGKAAA